MKINEFESIIENKWPSQQAEDFDNAGLLCGNREREITGVLVCHDALVEVVEEAIKKGCNLIFCFHPIIFSGLKSITTKNYVERAVLKAIENKIAIYAIHTSLDNDYFGVNYQICRELGLSNLKVLMPKKESLSYLTVYVPREHQEKVEKAIFNAGAGHIGFYDQCNFKVDGEGSFRPLKGSHPFIGNVEKREFVEECQLAFIFESYKQQSIIKAMKEAHPYEEVAYQIFNLENENQYLGLGQFGELQDEMTEDHFLGFIKEKFNLQVIKHSHLLGKNIKRVGVLGGSGASGIKAAIAQGCDAYISGDFKYHDFFLAENKILLLDIGHFESEQFVVPQIYSFFKEEFTELKIEKSKVKTNPVQYYI